MELFRDLSIKRRVTAVSFVTSAATLILAGAAFAAYEFRSAHESLVTQLSTQAQIIGFNCTSALLFDDDRAAAQTLAALQAEPQIAFAGIYTAEGRPFATYVRGRAARGAAPDDPPAPRAGVESGGEVLELTRLIGTEERPVGKVYLRADLSALRERGRRYVAITGTVLLVSLIAALALAAALQKHISEPVLELVKTARTVAEDRDYSLRASRRNRDELGTLVEAFNEMLLQIQERDEELLTVNRALETRTLELARKNEEGEAFVYIVSHDLRGPLVNIQGFSREIRQSCTELKERLAGAALSAAERKAVAEILETDIPDAVRFISASGGKFERLINALLQLSRSGRQEYRIEPLDMSAVLASTLDSLRQGIEKSGAEVKALSLPPALGDLTAVGQVLSNLVGNALKYLEPGRPGRVEIGGERDGRHARYYVRDNGVGIPEAARGRLFQVFQRFHPELAEGEGIGLATVKRIVERLGGTIWAESGEGKGTTMWFTLPALPDREEAA